MEEIRCGECGKLLAKGQIVILTIKCPRCGAMNHLRATTTSPTTEGPRASQEENRGQTRR